MKFKFKITCRAHHITFRNQNREYREINPRFLKNENRFVNTVGIKVRALFATESGIIKAWTEHNGTVNPDIFVRADDVFAIELIEEEEK